MKHAPSTAPPCDECLLLERAFELITALRGNAFAICGRDGATLHANRAFATLAAREPAEGKALRERCRAAIAGALDDEHPASGDYAWPLDGAAPSTAPSIFLVELSEPQGADPRVARLARALGWTPAEMRVVELAIRGLSDKEIAAQVGRSAATVHGHLKSIFRKTGVRSRGELAARVLG